MNTTHRATVSPVDDAPMADSIQEIIVFVDGDTEPTGILEFAAVLAQEYGAHLTGAFMRPSPAGGRVTAPPPRPTAPGVRRILVGWDAGRASARAVADALPLLVRAAAVEVLVVDPERRRAGHGQEPGADIARYLARHRARV